MCLLPRTVVAGCNAPYLNDVVRAVLRSAGQHGLPSLKSSQGASAARRSWRTPRSTSPVPTAHSPCKQSCHSHLRRMPDGGAALRLPWYWQAYCAPRQRAARAAGAGACHKSPGCTSLSLGGQSVLRAHAKAPPLQDTHFRRLQSARTCLKLRPCYMFPCTF